MRHFILLFFLTLAPTADAGWNFFWCPFSRLVRDATFLPRRPDLPFLRQNWALDASGADLMREHPALAQADYENNKVAVIDTGLFLNGNPEAGAGLLAASPEVEYDSHGTGVAGVVASKQYGVNPRLKVVAVPVRYDQQTMSNLFLGRVGFDARSLREKWRNLLDDPSVSVINLSMTDREDAEVQGYIREALAKGKWVVFAAGNTGAINDVNSAASGEFRGEPGFFVSGALSYLGAPATFSNHGPAVKFYSPGTSVDTLNADFNPNFIHTRTRTAYDGTSFSAPHLSAVLATLRALDPKLTPQDAEHILELTAIKRGTRGEYLQVNPLHAVELLARSKRMEKAGACHGASACLNAARASIASEVAGARVRPPRFSTRANWLAYYNELRRNYFLSNGDPAFAKPLRDFLKSLGREDAVDAIYYAAAHDNGPVNALKPEGTALREQHARARTALAAPAPEVAGAAVRLRDIPTVPENVDKFLARTETYFQTGADPEGAAEALSEARKPFIMALAKKLAEKEQPIAAPAIFFSLPALATTPAEKTLAAQVTDLVVRGWKTTGDVDALRALVTLAGTLTPEQRNTLLQDFLAHRKAGTLKGRRTIFKDPLNARALVHLERQMRVWQADLGVPEAEVRGTFLPARTMPGEDWTEVANWHFAASRFYAGHLSDKDLGKAFRRFLDHHESKPVATDEQTVNALNFFMAYATHNEAGARAVAEALIEGKHLRTLETLMTADVTILRLLELVKDGPLRAKLVEGYINVAKSGSLRNNQALASNVFSQRKKPEVQAYINAVIAQKPTDPGMQQIRLEFLKYSAVSDESLNDHGRRYLEETAENGVKKLYTLPFGQVANDPALLAELQAQLKAPDWRGNDPMVLMAWATSASPKDFAKVQETIATHFAANVNLARYVPAESMMRFGHYFAAVAGGNRELNQTLMHQVETLLADPKYGRREESEGPHPLAGSTRDEGTVLLALELARGKEGARVLGANPRMLQAIADKIVASPEVTYFQRQEPVFPPLGKLLATRLPTLDEMEQRGYVPRWALDYLRSEPAEQGRLLELLKTPRMTRGGAQVQEELLTALYLSLQAHPETVDRVRAFGRANPDSYIHAVLEELGYTP